MSQEDVFRTDETSRHIARRHFFNNIQKAKSGSERSVSNRPDFETRRSETLLYQHAGSKKWLGTKCLELTKLRDTSL